MSLSWQKAADDDLCQKPADSCSVTTCFENRENREMSRNFTAVRKMSRILFKNQGNVSEKILSGKIDQKLSLKLHQ